ncbi:MAG: HDOD domain-containing protein [Gammaproteobacteria bacterium]|nr:HDOD domain-containing protein [Gammaproteobacteria bacterium]
MTEIDLIVNQFILEKGKLYTLPELYHQLEEKILSNTASIDEIGEIISTDATLSAKILRIANSPLYGFRAQVSTLNRALSLVGIKEVKNLILLDALAGNFNDDNQCKAINMEDFWRRSVYLALISKRLSNRLKHPEPDRIFISAIMSRLGQLVCCSTRTDEVTQILSKHLNNSEYIEFDLESDALGFTYNEVSAKILEHWKVPKEIIVSLQYLHSPLEAPEEIKNTCLNDLCILNAATLYSGYLELDEAMNKQVNPSELQQSDEQVIDLEKNYLNRVNPMINELLNIDKKTIEDILFEIETDALQILGIIFPK